MVSLTKWLCLIDAVYLTLNGKARIKSVNSPAKTGLDMVVSFRLHEDSRLSRFCAAEVDADDTPQTLQYAT